MYTSIEIHTFHALVLHCDSDNVVGFVMSKVLRVFGRILYYSSFTVLKKELTLDRLQLKKPNKQKKKTVVTRQVRVKSPGTGEQ